eukprot:COSAG04_NODE_5401_length_1630_cov_1.672763_2_plen_164_part_01
MNATVTLSPCAGGAAAGAVAAAAAPPLFSGASGSVAVAPTLFAVVPSELDRPRRRERNGCLARSVAPPPADAPLGPAAPPTSLGGATAVVSRGGGGCNLAAASTAADAEAKSGRPWEERGEIRAIGDGGCFCSLCRPSGIAERLGEEAARAPSPRLFGVPEPPE